MRTLRIAAIGCGTAGPAAALLLHRQGHEVELFERVPEPAPVGAGILLQPTGMVVLEELQLLDEVRRCGARIDHLHGITDRGRTVMDIHYAEWRPDAFGLGVHRGILFGALWRTVKDEGITTHCGVDVIAIKDSEVHTDEGTRHGPYDLVIIADGARSILRPSTGLTRKAERYPWGALFAIVEDTQERYAGVLAQTYRGTTEMVGTLPSGRLEDRPPCVSLFWSLREDDLATQRAAGLARFKDRVLGLQPKLEPVTDQLHDFDQLLYAAYHDVVLRQWHTPDGRIAVLGDAGHAMSPQLGQGANLALIDAWTLSDCLGSHEEPVAALREYSRRRRAHLRFYAWASRLLTPVYQSQHGRLAPPRDLLMHPLARLPWLRDQMVMTLAGVKTGPLSTLKGRDARLMERPVPAAAPDSSSPAPPARSHAAGP